MNTKHLWLGALILAILVVGFVFLGGNGPSIGGSTADDWSIGGNLSVTGTSAFTGATSFSGALTVPALTASGEVAVQGFTQGGGEVELTPTSGSLTLTEANLLAGNVISFVASSTMPAFTVTLPATSTMTTLLPSTGDMRSWVLENPFTAAATTTTIAAGTGIDLQENDGQNVVIGINNYAWITCFREASTDVVCSINESIPAD
jgi:hypothetical protein